MKKLKIDLENLKNEGLASVSPMERREFLKIGLAITGVFAGGTLFSAVSNINRVFASPEEMAEKYPYKPHYSMVLRQSRCIDCERCVEACNKTNEVPDYGYRTRILERDVPDAIGMKREFIPVLCNHCNNPPCVRACPTKATTKDKKNGIVMMLDQTKLPLETVYNECRDYQTVAKGIKELWVRRISLLSSCTFLTRESSSHTRLSRRAACAVARSTISRCCSRALIFWVT